MILYSNLEHSVPAWLEVGCHQKGIWKLAFGTFPLPFDHSHVNTVVQLWQLI